MKETVNILGIEIDNITAKESMKRAFELMEADGLSTIEMITVDMLLNEQDNQEMKDAIRTMDLVLPGTSEILKSADITDPKRLQNASERPFMKIFLKYLQKNHKRVFLLAGDESERDLAESLLQQNFKGLSIVGSDILEEGGSEDMIVNDINGLEVDCIVSVLPSPRQELFVVRNSPLLNAGIWLGCSSLLKAKYEEKMKINRLKNFFVWKIFRHKVEKQKKQNDS